MTEKKSPSRTLFERKTDEEIVDEYGSDGWIVAFIKSFSTHDSDRNRRRRERDEKYSRKDNDD